MQASPDNAVSPPSMPRYVPLPENQSIRMLVLNPGFPSDLLEGKLEIVNINFPGSYEALSYVWGSPKRSHAIDCDGTKLELTTSLYDALQRLRLPHKSRRLWVDQICIDQNNLGERSQQVQFMNSIYWNATHVLVWLGIDSQNVAYSAFKLIHELAERFSDEAKHAQFRADHTNQLEKLSKDKWIPVRRMTELPWVSTPPAISAVTLQNQTFVDSMRPSLVHARVDSSRDWDQSASHDYMGRKRDRLEDSSSCLRRLDRIPPSSKTVRHRNGQDQICLPALHRAREDKSARQSLCFHL